MKNGYFTISFNSTLVSSEGQIKKQVKNGYFTISFKTTLVSN